MASLRVGDYEINNGSIGKTDHGGRGVGWQFEPIWSPGDPDEKLKTIMEDMIRFGEKQRTRDIGALLGITIQGR